MSTLERHAGSDVPALHSPSACGCTMSTGAIPTAPPLLLVHGGRDHCRNWDWVAEALRRDWHIIAPDLRGHGDSQWSPDGNYTMAGYIYDLAQLIHQQKLAPVTIVAHSLGGNIACATPASIPRTSRKLVAIEGLGPSPEDDGRARRKQPIAERMRDWIDEQRELSGRLPRRYASIEDAFKRMQEENKHLSPEQARHLTAARRQPERGRHLQLEVRQLRALLAALRHDLAPTSRSCGRASPARRCWSTARRAGPPIRPRTAALRAFQERRGRRRSRAPATGCTTTGSTNSSTRRGGSLPRAKALIEEIRACTVCAASLAAGPRPVVAVQPDIAPGHHRPGARFARARERRAVAGRQR